MAGDSALANGGHGIRVENSVGTVIGGHVAGFGNLISGNAGDGVLITGSRSRDNVVAGNLIGIDWTGNKSVGNLGRGVTITDDAGSTRIGTDGDGEYDAAERNVISGNLGDGIGVLNTGAALGLYQWKVADGGNDHYYIVCPPRTWAMSEGIAVISGGHLASITTPQELGFVNSAIFPDYITRSFWIGLNDAQTEGTYRWTTGEPFTYSNWDLPQGQPNALCIEDWVEMTSINGYWDDRADYLQLALMEFSSLPDLALLTQMYGPPNTIAGNYIGTDVSGTVSVPNTANGIRIDGSSATRIGGPLSPEANLISGNKFNGITIYGANSVANEIYGNSIGTNVSKTLGIPNGGRGITIAEGPSKTVIGTNSGLFQIGAANTISGNANSGIGFANVLPMFQAFQWKAINGGNDHYYVVAPLRNAFDSELAAKTAGGNLASITTSSEQQFIQTVVLPSVSYSDLWIGLNDVSTEGKYAWNTKEPFVYSNWIASQPDNYLGAQDYVIMNRSSGRWDDNSGSLIFASLMEFESAPDFGILASHYLGRNFVAGNAIGSNPSGTLAIANNGSGIVIDNASNVVVGGKSAAQSNFITHNGGDGIEIIGVYSAKNSINGNHIHSNGGLGIDLNNDGVTVNDLGDTDQGVNGQMNFPVISKALSGAATFVFGNYSGLASSTVALDFYASATADPSGYGEGDRYLGSTVVNTDASGMALFQFKLSAATAVGEVVSATATDSFGNTSEFSLNTVVDKAPPTAIVDVNAGQAQRSIVKDFTATFSEPVSFPDGLAAAIQLQRSGPGGPMGLVGLSFTQLGNTVTAIINDSAYTENGSLIDGKYSITLVAAKISGTSGNLDGDVNGVGGDDLIVTFHRLFGDADGDAAVSASDFNAFRLAYGASGLSMFDFDNDGLVSAADFNQFRLRYGISLMP